NLFAPRAGATYRLGKTAVVRGGFGITNDPYSLARSMRTNHPVLLNMIEEAANSYAWVRPVEEGISPGPDVGLGHRIIPVPGDVTVVPLPTRFKRGRSWSWNLTYEKELLWGFAGEAAYVGTRQVDQLGQIEQNWASIGGGSAGRQMFARFGRTAPTLLIAPV